MTFSIVIPIHNRLELTRQGLANLYEALGRYRGAAAAHQAGTAVSSRAGGSTFHVIVVDDGSTDGSADWIAAHYPDIHLLKGDGNLWWSGSVNVGARYAVETLHDDFVILWNDDTECDPEYFTELEKVMTLDPVYRESILVSKILWQDQPDVLFNFGCYFDARRGKKTLIGWNQKDGADYGRIIPVDWSGGMGTVIPASVLKTTDYFDAKIFPQYHGDSDFFLRAKDKQTKAFAIPTLRILNNRGTTVGGPKRLSDLKKMLYFKGSRFNLKQNMQFTARHANHLRGWSTLLRTYTIVLAKSLKQILWGPS
ncbi:glycosyltransferase family 2 protein [Dinghuibacter silviterrae]|uniref:GT2 family glycosyltransferase n=1 Tax=Dinghuibacter silviterrae TaxID=1539049 RepID=A0A4R8DWA2_9BACT|nr:glycosyltransferase family 2 protein [Dinghuibacter silviterrae]TDX01775.1 GT2 family glycosyltransferase [Dinghuibacter silviterrae]